MLLNYNILEWQRHTLPIVYCDKGLVYVGGFGETLEEAKAFLDKKGVYTWQFQSEVSDYGREIVAYLNGERREWTVAVHWLVGTPFQQAVWETLRKIPFGESTSYGEIAKRLNRPKAVRAVGAAIGRNPIMLVVPCHRVLSKAHSLTGFRGGLSMKQQLLEIEGIAYRL